MIVLERVAKNFPGGHGETALPKLSVRNFVQTIVEGFAEADGSERVGVEQLLDDFVFVDHAAIGCAIFFGKFGKFCAGAIEIAPLRQVAAVGKRHMKDGIGIDVFEAVVAKSKFVVAKKRIAMNAVVRGRADVVDEPAQSEFGGLDAAAKDGAAF